MENKNTKKDYIVSLDVGSSKVSMLLGLEDNDGKLNVVNLASVKSNGVINGAIRNIEKAMSDIKKCFEILTQNETIQVSKIHVGIAGKHIDPIKHNDVILRENNLDVITSNDINDLVSKVYKYILPPGHQIVHILQQDFIIDGNESVTDPVGMIGNKIEGEFHIVTRDEYECAHVKRCVEGAKLNLGSLTLTSIASSMAVLRDDEKKYGVCVLDIGESTTDIVIYKDDVIRYIDVIPFGGNIITKDIYDECGLIPELADNLKTDFGSALASEIKKSRLLSFDVKNGRNQRRISEVNLARIIQARMTDIIDFALTKIVKNGFYDDLINGFVLTGGGSKLRDLDKLVELRSGLPTRIGLPIYHLAAGGYAKKLSDPTYAAVIGLAVNAMYNDYNSIEEVNEEELVESEGNSSEVLGKTTKIFKNVYAGFLDFFTEVEDADFEKK